MDIEHERHLGHEHVCVRGAGENMKSLLPAVCDASDVLSKTYYQWPAEKVEGQAASAFQRGPPFKEFRFNY